MTQTTNPVHRLLDIVVEEVSLVDHPANQRRFLVVKRSDEMQTLEETDVEVDEEEIEKAKGKVDEEEDEEEEDAEEEEEDKKGKAKKSDDPSILQAIQSALEQLTEAVESLSGTIAAPETPRLDSIARDLRTASETLAGAAEPESTGRDGEPKAEPAAKEKEPSVESIVSSIQGLLGRIEQHVKAQEPEKENKEPTQKSVHSPEPSDPTGSQLGQVISLLRSLDTTVKEQGKRIARMEKRSGLPNSTDTTEHTKATKPLDEQVGWPLDINRPLDRDSVDKSVSFHD